MKDFIVSYCKSLLDIFSDFLLVRQCTTYHLGVDGVIFKLLQNALVSCELNKEVCSLLNFVLHLVFLFMPLFYRFDFGVLLSEHFFFLFFVNGNTTGTLCTFWSLYP